MVKCSECGFLTLRSRIEGDLIEVDSEYRKYGKTPVKYIQNIENFPLCFVNSYNLIKDEVIADKQIPHIVPGEGDITEWPKYVLMVIQKERQCENFTKWQQGFTPKEHREMLDRQWLIKYQDDQRKDDRKWQNDQQVRLVVIAGIFTILGAIIGALIAIFR